MYLEGQDPEKDINFYINSPGGSITDGMAIYDTMRYIKLSLIHICGPVCVAAVILDPAAPVDGVNDSKKLSEKKRERCV